jgi:hypothetical protein
MPALQGMFMFIKMTSLISLIWQVITVRGHSCLFLPKFHPELNPIEHYWGWVKCYFHERCKENYAAARKLLDEALNACTVMIIQWFFRHVHRYMSVYSLGTTELLIEFAVKKYHSYRGVTTRDLLRFPGRAASIWVTWCQNRQIFWTNYE